MNSTTATTHFANELIFGFGASSGQVTTPGQGFSVRSTFESNMTEDKFVSAAGAYNATETTQNASDAWAMFMVTFKAAPSITLTPPIGSGEYVAAKTPITIKIGTNATQQQTGVHQIANPSTPGTYAISVGGTFGGSGNIPVSINAGFEVTATMVEQLDFSAESVSSTLCTANGGASVTAVTSTDTAVHFDVGLMNMFYQACHDLTVSTNAGGGYVLTAQETYAMRTADGTYTIPDTTCDDGMCTPGVAASWLDPNKNGFGHTCWNVSGSDCAGAYANGTKFRPFANVATGNGGAQFVQKNQNFVFGGTSVGTTLNGITAKNAIVAGVYWGGAGITLNSVTDNCSEPQGFTLLDNPTDVGDVYGALAYNYNVIGGNCTLTANFSGSVVEAGIWVHEVSGISTSDPLDGHRATLDIWRNAPCTDCVSSGSITTGSSGDYIFGFTYNSSSSPHNAGTGFTRRSTGDNLGMTEDRVQSSAGAIAATFSRTDTTAGTDVPFVLALRPSGSVGSVLMASSTPAIATGRVKYRLSVPALQAAGTYTTILDYIITATY